MPTIYPFRAVTFNKGRVGNISKVITQPYDKIDQNLQDVYYKRHPNNIVRVINGRDEARDNGEKNKYSRAADTFKKWLDEGVLARDERWCFYAYYQSYKTGDTIKVRKGLTALVKLEEFGKGKIHPHEETHTGPKADRFKLMSATNAHFGHIFMLYSDEKGEINNILDEAANGTPFLEAQDDFEELHKVWRITDAEAIKKIQKLLAGKDIIIADGHHRYETALNYKNEMARQSHKPAGVTENYENVLATLINMDAEGLTLFPTHRLVYGLSDFSFSKIVRAASDYFIIKEYPFTNSENEKYARIEMLEDLYIEGLAKCVFGVAAANESSYYLLAIKNEKDVIKLIKEKKSDAWKKLDINILHAVILENALGITKEKLAHEENVEFLRSVDEAIDKVRSNGKYQAAFLVNPTKVKQVKEIVKNNERFPQKTTDFYPKLLTGLIMNKIEIVS